MNNDYIQISSVTDLLMVDNDYEYSLLHVVCLDDEEGVSLVFAFVELYPSEQVTPFALPLNEYAIDEESKLVYSQLLMKAEDAVSWYEACQGGEVNLSMLTEGGGVIKGRTPTKSMKWPGFLTSGDLSFLGSSWGIVRSHFIKFTEDSVKYNRLINNSSAMRWVSDQLLVEMFDNLDLIGCIYFVAPNPVFRNIGCSLGVGESEYIDFDFVTRCKMELKDTYLTLNELRDGRIEKQHIVPVNKKYVRVVCSNKVDQVSYQVVCKSRGVLEDQPPVSFIRSIGVSVGVNDGGEKTSRSSSNSSNQRWFHENSEAEKFFKENISKARTHVVVIDSDVLSTANASMALSVTRSEVSFSFVFRESSCLGTSEKIALRTFLDQTIELSNKHKRSIDVYIMKSSESSLKDRLFIVDDDVWLFGNPIGNMGDAIIARLSQTQGIVREVTSGISGVFLNANEWLDDVSDGANETSH